MDKLPDSLTTIGYVKKNLLQPETWPAGVMTLEKTSSNFQNYFVVRIGK